MTLSQEKKLQLRKKAHHLRPVIIIGNKGLTDAVQLEIERALLDHELIKIKINNNDRKLIKSMFDEICEAREAEFIQTVGHTAVIYRENEDLE